MTDHIAHLLGLGPLLDARLRAALPAAAVVLSGVSLAEARRAGRLPDYGAEIYYVGGSVLRAGEGRTDGRVAQLRQRWGVAVADRDLGAGSAGAAAAQANAGSLADLVLDALLGYQPAGLDLPLYLIETPAPIAAGGRLLVPLVFGAHLTYVATPTGV